MSADKVYVVTHQHHEDVSILGVFSSRGGASLAVDGYLVPDERPHLHVEEFTLDEVDPDA